MNLPDYLAPAPPFNEEAHGFDFPLYVKRLGDGRGFYATCRCGASETISEQRVSIAVDGFWPFRRWMAEHVAKEERAHALKHKWGGAAAFAPESAERGIAVQDERVVEAVVVQNMPNGIDKVEITG